MMKTIDTYISEAFRLRDDTNIIRHKYHPETSEELRKIICKIYDEQGPGTEKRPVNLNNIDISRINNMEYVFCGSVHDTSYNKIDKLTFEYIDISKWDMGGVMNTSNMFSFMRKLKSVGDLSGWDMRNVLLMRSMFHTCSNLKKLVGIENWNVKNCQEFSQMFAYTPQLTDVGDISKWKVSMDAKKQDVFFASGLNRKLFPNLL